MKNERILAYKLNEEELELVTGGRVNFGNCNFYDFGKEVAGWGIGGATYSARLGPSGALSGTGWGALAGAAYYGGTYWW